MLQKCSKREKSRQILVNTKIHCSRSLNLVNSWFSYRPNNEHHPATLCRFCDSSNIHFDASRWHQFAPPSLRPSPPPSLLPVVCHRRRHRLGSAAIMFITRLVAGVVGARAGVTTASPTRRWSSPNAARDFDVSAAVSSGSRTSASARLLQCSADQALRRPPAE